MNRIRGKVRRFTLMAIICNVITAHVVPVATVNAQVSISAPSAILMEASTGEVIYELNATERRCPASITKIMSLILIFEALDQKKITLQDQVTVSEYAASMGGSQVYLPFAASG